jgi:class 3 adenylate cyclase
MSGLLTESGHTPDIGAGGGPVLGECAQSRRAVGALQGAGMSPRMALLTFQAILTEADVRHILGSVHVPTFMLNRENDAISVNFARDLAADIPSARLVELDSVDRWPVPGNLKSITGEAEDFVSRRSGEHIPDRVLATVLFTDIVDSTRHAAELGDRSWRELLERHDQTTHTEVARFHGRVVKHTGDGVLASFDGPTRALRCATALAERIPELGIDIRCGLHTGECEMRGDDIGGIAVHIGARIAALARAGEVLVSSLVKDLANGSEIAFQDCGTHVLKGVPGEWRLFSPARPKDACRSAAAIGRPLPPTRFASLPARSGLCTCEVR